MDFMGPRGRGRGRKKVDGIGIYDINTTSSVNDVIHQIDILLLDGGDNVELDNIYKMSEAAIKSDEDIEFVVSAICNSCFTNDAFIKIGSKVCCNLLPIQAKNIKFRSCLLNFLQKEYENREKKCAESPQRFLNTIKFFAQLSMDIKLNCSAASDLLKAAIFDYLIMLTDSKVESHATLLQKLMQDIGSDLISFANREPQRASKYLDKLQLKLRQKIVDDSISKSQRVTFLMSFEMSIRGFEKLNENAKSFYQQNK